MGAAIALAAVAGHADEAMNVWRWIPLETRVVVQFDPGARDQTRAREVLGVDALSARFVIPPKMSQSDQVTVAFIPNQGTADLVAFTHGKAALTQDFAKLRGAHLESTAGHSLFGVRSTSGAAIQLGTHDVVEGPRRALTDLLQRSQRTAATLAAVESESAQRLVQRPLLTAAPVSLLYIAPPGGADLYAVLQDLDRTFGAEMAAALQPYQKPLQMLGLTHALRLDLRQRGGELETTLWLAMPNRMAAQIASVSLDASRDMVRVAARGAVKSGGMSADDVQLLEEALATLETRADGDLVRVDVRVPREPAP
jgi:hypothetical protein